MRIVSDGTTTELYGGRFTGTVNLEMLSDAETAGRPDIARVSFADGAVTFWHSHPGGQKLLIISGVRRMGTEDGETELLPGTFVDSPADERHYHGAAIGQDCTVLAITWGATVWEDLAP